MHDVLLLQGQSTSYICVQLCVHGWVFTQGPLDVHEVELNYCKELPSIYACRSNVNGSTYSY